MANEPDVARVAAAFNAPGLRYRSFGNMPVRTDAPRREASSQSPEVVLRELRSTSAAVRLAEGEASLPPRASAPMDVEGDTVTFPASGFAPAPVAPAPAPPPPVMAPLHVAPTFPVQPAVAAAPPSAPIPPPSFFPPAPVTAAPLPMPAPTLDAGLAVPLPLVAPAGPAVPEFTLLNSIQAALESPPVAVRPAPEGTLARLRQQVASPAGAVQSAGPAVTFPLGEAIRSMAGASPSPAPPNDTFGAAPRSSSPF